MPAATRIVVVGATSRIAEHCCRLWANAGSCEFVLVGRNASYLDRIADDLRVRGAAVRTEAMVDFTDALAVGEAVARWAADGAIDIAMIAHGVLPEQTACQSDLALTRATIAVNALSPALFAEAFATAMTAAGKGTIAMLGSVAGDRGKRSNYTYGAAKGLVERYAEGLQHRFARGPLKVVLIKPGPTDTPMSARYKEGGRRVAPVDAVAADIVEAVKKGRPVTYSPSYWRPVMFVIRALPNFVFNRLNI
jgi:short-subunit dehydrogenase